MATVRSGQLGKIKKVTVHLPDHHLEGRPFATAPVPDGLNWDFWQGQAPAVDYVPERCHYTFRWWYDYSGGMLTDWGAHHLDIAQWALNMENSGPRIIDGSKTVLPNIPGGYTTPGTPLVAYQYPGDVIVQVVTDEEREGVLFEGEKGRIYVNRDKVTGKPIEDARCRSGAERKDHERREGPVQRQPGQTGRSHGQFLRGLQAQPAGISDVESQHRSVSVCHLGNISIRLGRKIEWDPEKQEIVGDSEANAMLQAHQQPASFG